MSEVRSPRRLAGSLVGRLLNVPGVFRARRVVVAYQWPDFGRKCRALADLLQRHGLPVEIRTGSSLLDFVKARASRDLWIGYWYDFPPDYLPRDYVFLNAEPLTHPKWRDNAIWTRMMRGAREVWGYTRANESVVKALGVPFRYVPFGYAPYYEESFRAHTQGKPLAEDIDVLFLGEVTERRGNMLRELEARGLIVKIIGRENPLYGASLDEVIARSRILLGIHNFTEPALQIADFARMDHFLANRRFIIHEALNPATSDPAFEAVVPTAPYEQLAEVCARYAVRPEERHAIADRAYDWFRAERSLDALLPYAWVREHLGMSREG